MRPKLIGLASVSGRGLNVYYLAELTIEKTDTSQDYADSVLAVSYRHSYE